MKYCVQCGAELSDNAKFCPNCGSGFPVADEGAQGAPVRNAPPAPAPKPAPKKKSKVPAVIAVLLVIVILIGAGILAIPNLLNPDDNADTDDSFSDSSEDEEVSDSDEEEIADIISEAEELAAEKDYEGALAEITAGLEEYPKSEALQAKSDEYTAALNTQIKEANLAEAAALAEDGDYVAAMERIQDAQDTYGDDPDYQKAYDTYNQSYIDEIKTEALETAGDFAKKKDYLSAYDTIAEAVKEIGEDADLTKKAAEYETAYVTDITAQADALIKEGNISAAKDLLLKATSNFPNNASLKDYTEETDKYQTVLLNSLTPINGGFTWNDGTPEDPFGNDYANSQNYTILHEDDHYKSSTYSAEYMIDGQYDLLTFTVSPYSDFGQKCSSYIQIYADDTLRYTMPKVVQKTQPQTISVDVSNATYIKIVATVGADYGCIMLSDVMLSCVPNYVSSQSSEYTPLSTLDTFNGSISWNKGYPQSNRGDDYSNVKNYSILHEDDHYKSSTYSAEYYVNKQYTSFSFNIAPAEDFGASCTSYVEVYLDDVLVYTSPDITQKTELFSSGVIDISNTTYLKIVIKVGKEYGCLILSDVLLKNK